MAFRGIPMDTSPFRGIPPGPARAREGEGGFSRDFLPPDQSLLTSFTAKNNF